VLSRICLSATQVGGLVTHWVLLVELHCFVTQQKNKEDTTSPVTCQWALYV
jgi:hypothetical protein